MTTRRSPKLTPWRIGRRNPLNVYEGVQGAEEDRSICQTHRVEDAQMIVDAVNAMIDRRKCPRCRGGGRVVPRDVWPPPAPRDCSRCPECDETVGDEAAEADELCAEVARLREALRREREPSCVACDATLEPTRDEPPHCSDCVPTDDHIEEWERARIRQENDL